MIDSDAQRVARCRHIVEEPAASRRLQPELASDRRIGATRVVSPITTGRRSLEIRDRRRALRGIDAKRRRPGCIMDRQLAGLDGRSADSPGRGIDHGPARECRFQLQLVIGPGGGPRRIVGQVEDGRFQADGASVRYR